MREQAGVREGGRRAQLVAQRPLARPFEPGIGEQQDLPAVANPAIEIHQRLGRLGERMGHEQKRRLAERLSIGRPDRNDAVARFERRQRFRSSAGKREFFGKDERQGGEHHQRRAPGLLPRRDVGFAPAPR